MRTLARPEEIHRLLNEVKRHSGQNASLCIQCGKCSAGCPIAPEMDLLPSQVLQLLQTGGEEKVLNSHTIWLCAGCQTCSTRCPENIDIALIMDTLRKISLDRGISPAEKDVGLFNRIFLETVKYSGRLYEFGMVMGFNVFSKQLFKDALMAPLMFAKGKIHLIPHLSPKSLLEMISIYRRSRRFLPSDKEAGS